MSAKLSLLGCLAGVEVGLELLAGSGWNCFEELSVVSESTRYFVEWCPKCIVRVSIRIN
jgi:hypothetical protein